jgi:hypothetical protein
MENSKISVHSYYPDVSLNMAVLSDRSITFPTSERRDRPIMEVPGPGFYTTTTPPLSKAPTFYREPQSVERKVKVI